MPAFTLVVPLYEEEERVAEFAPRLLEFVAGFPGGAELLFVDDGSTDHTAAAVEKVLAVYPDVAARLVRRPHVGKGGAVSAGLREARGTYAGFCDIDLSTPLDQFQRVLDVARRAPVLAIGSRDVAGSELVRPEAQPRELLGRLYNRVLQATITPGIVDTQCGAKVARRDLWVSILRHCREHGFAWDAEAIGVARALGITVQEVPIRWRHDDRSRVNVVRDGTAMLSATPRIWRTVRETRVERARAAAAPEVFDDRNVALLMEADHDRWWFRSKAALVSSALRRTRATSPPGGWLADVGAGAGGVTSQLGWDPRRTVALEGNEVLVARAARVHALSGVRADCSHLPIADGSVRVVCLLDVLEHLEDPVLTLGEARRVLAPEGRLVVNVPAHRWLWSAADEVLGHKRRYTRRTLAAQLTAAGFRPQVLTHVFTWLVLPVWVKRRVMSRGSPELGLDQTSPTIDRIAMALTFAERVLLGRVSMPFGTSVLCVAVPVR